MAPMGATQNALDAATGAVLGARRAEHLCAG